MSAAAPAVELFKPGSKRTGPLSLLCEATYKGTVADRIKRVSELIAAGADVNGLCYPESSGSQTAFRSAIGSNQPQILKLFLDAGAKMTAKDLEDSIGWFIPSPKQEISIMLIDAGAPVTRQALRLAVIEGKEKVVKRLLEAGANPNEPDSFGMTPFSEVIFSFDSYRAEGMERKELVAREQILDMFIAGGADLVGNIARGNTNALTLVLERCPQYLEKILKGGAVATINTPSGNGLPLVYAATYGKWRDVRTLLKYGADPHLIPAGALKPDVMRRVIEEAAHIRRRHALAALGGLPAPSAVAGAGASAVRTLKAKRSKNASKTASRRNRKSF